MVFIFQVADRHWHWHRHWRGQLQTPAVMFCGFILCVLWHLKSSQLAFTCSKSAIEALGEYIGKRCGIGSRVTIKTSEWRCFSVFIFNFKNILHLFLVFLLLTLNKRRLAGLTDFFFIIFQKCNLPATKQKKIKTLIRDSDFLNNFIFFTFWTI